MGLFSVFVVGGIYRPSRFRRGTIVQLAATPRIDEGVAWEIRTVHGSRAGFYRDARVFITGDYRVIGKNRGAVARLRADRGSIMMRPEFGTPLWRKSVGDRWERAADHEEPIEPGVVYKAGDDRLFFELGAR